ncbi:phage antirepressor KilAC domain-containing protein [Microbulbifer salipaludis]|uniref:Phage antirepressor KilAC domain-containing protein n=1 Tax=Microbulbifer salipaludis TaxID=187980 RepID=A0ABS3E981_9GAMM|nr:phage antirepressor KilAC domain-containing protein [Microbulbifer salipaludis]MBN8431837.1 phage antirepressor KilAC domain-containing protein [Microbulbifer salipaludis]
MREKLLTLTQAARQLGIGRNTLLKKLRDHGLLLNSERFTCAPSKAAVTNGLLHPKLSEFYRGPVRVQHITAHVTAAGLVHIKDLLDREAEETASAS